MPTRQPLRAHARRFAVVVTAVLLAACSSPGPDVIPTPSHSTPSPTPSPVTTTDADGRALPGFVTSGVDLPDALPAPPGVLATTAPGWILATYRPAVYPQQTADGAMTGFAATAQVVYLVNPDGVRYQLLELDPSEPLVIDSWSAGDTVAYVRACEPRLCIAGVGPELSLDLQTGAVAAVPGVASDVHVGATISGQVRWWQNDARGASGAALDRNGTFGQFHGAWSAWSTSPSGRYLAVTRDDQAPAGNSSLVAIVDTATGTLTDLLSLLPAPFRCVPFRWRTGDILDVTCHDPLTSEVQVFSVGAAASAARENNAVATAPVAGSAWVQPNFYVTKESWAGPYWARDANHDTSSPLAGLARGGKFEPLPLPPETSRSSRVVAAVGGSVYVESSATDGSRPALVTASRYDLATGTLTVLVPIPPGGPTRGLAVNEGAPASGLTSWVVAP